MEEKDVGLGSQKGKIRALTDTEKMVFCKINKDFFFLTIKIGNPSKRRVLSPCQLKELREGVGES